MTLPVTETSPRRQTNSAVDSPISQQDFRHITAKAEKIASSSIEKGQRANLGEVTNALLDGLKRYRPDIFNTAIEILSKRTGTPYFSKEAFDELVLLLNKYGVYYNERGTLKERQKSGSFVGPVYMPVVRKLPINTLKEFVVNSGLILPSEIPSIQNVLLVDQPQWKVAGVSERGQVVVNRHTLRENVGFYQSIQRTSPAFKGVNIQKATDAAAAHEFTHYLLEKSLQLIPTQQEPFTAPPHKIDENLIEGPSTAQEAHELIAHAVGISVTQATLMDIIVRAIVQINIKEASHGRYEPRHNQNFPGYEATWKFAMETLLASFDARQDPTLRNTLKTYGETSEKLYAEYQLAKSDKERRRLDNLYHRSLDNFSATVFKVMKQEDRVFMANQFLDYAKELLEHIRQSKINSQPRIP